ncbi:MucR family transcriptional regulator [Salinarimonas soli]|uniref:MucR family transcriptional regulator n=1 Tax=Salinarimonas soli TaxID=1638099 RepID=A0A5B2V6Z7_9HYPH|nr:MucR family transcriptional regulator [Salinarimonas soli]KAA2234172.1 MucR family transcriptional regulator [Salinarimonas soli]
MQAQDNDQIDYVALTADVVAAYVTHNRVSSSEIPDLIAAVHRSLNSPNTPAEPEPAKLEPRMPIKKTITADFLISLEDGKQYRSLKRHLTTMGLTPEAYRTKWGLPHDYRMVAPNYSKQRFELAKSLGLGQMRRREAAAGATNETTAAEPKAKRGRPKKTEPAA